MSTQPPAVPYGGGRTPPPQQGGEMQSIKSSPAPAPLPEPEPDLDAISTTSADDGAIEAAGEAAAFAQREAEDKEMVMLDIVVLYSDDGYCEPPPGFWKVPYDLNKGAGGNFIYLATKSVHRQDPRLLEDGPNGLGTPITDLCVITGRSKDIQAPVGYTKVEGDLNYGTGGNFVFLCYHRGQLAEPVSELFAMGGKTNEMLAPPPGYAKIDADLNSGALMGEKITICVRRARPLAELRPQHVITDLYVVYDNKGTIEPPPGFFKFPYDLNKGTSGNYVYLCYRLGFLGGPDDPVTDIVVCADAMRHGPGTQPPGPGYVRLEADLNAGAAGHFVYLAYKKARDEPPITDLYVMGGRKEENLSPPRGFEQIPLNLNIQNWGNWAAYYLYLCVKRHTPADE